MKRKLSPPHLRPSSKLGVPDYSSREARESFLEDQHAPQAKVRFNTVYCMKNMTKGWLSSSITSVGVHLYSTPFFWYY